MSEEKGIHDGHRNRLRERFLKCGLEKFYDHQVIELLLFYGIPRKDTNDIAHKLIDRFGSFSGIFDAPVEALEKCGLSYNCAVFIKLIPAVCSRYYIDKYHHSEPDEDKDSIEELGEYFLPHFIGVNKEQLFIALFNEKGRLIYGDAVSRGSLCCSDVNVSKIISLCVENDAASIVVAHSHTNGISLPTKKDTDMIKRLKSSLKAIGVMLADFFIIADMQYTAISTLEDFEDLLF